MVERNSVLIVDDDAAIRLLLQTTLEQMLGVRVDTAEDGLQALHKVGRQRPALILLDLMMPAVDGLEVLRRLRADPKTRDIPVIVLSAVSRAREEASHIGCNEMLAKPFDLDVFLGLVSRYIPGQVAAGNA